jgi:hypothetical protein
MGNYQFVSCTNTTINMTTIMLTQCCKTTTTTAVEARRKTFKNAMKEIATGLGIAVGRELACHPSGHSSFICTTQNYNSNQDDRTGQEDPGDHVRVVRLFLGCGGFLRPTKKTLLEIDAVSRRHCSPLFPYS